MINQLSNNTSHISSLHNAGLYSNITEMLKAIQYEFSGGRKPVALDFKKSHSMYKDKADQDLFSDLYRIDENNLMMIKPQLNPLNILTHHGGSATSIIYKQMNFKYYTLILNTYFNASIKVENKIKELCAAKEINYNKTIAVHYRGTDKHSESKLVSPKSYIELVENIRQNDPTCKILILSDQKQVIDLFLSHFSDCFTFEELPVSQTKVGVHFQVHSKKTDYAIALDAACRIAARCKYLIVGSGNMAFFISIYRGHNKNLYQFDRQGNLVESSPGFFMSLQKSIKIFFSKSSFKMLKKN